MATFGSFALLIALALAAYNLLAGAVALRLIATGQPARISPERLADTARRAGIAGFVAVTGAAFALVWSVFTNDFSITYILEHSNRALPGPYKFAALWSGQEGSLLLWAWLLGDLRLCSPPDPQNRRQALRLRRHHSRRRPGLLPRRRQLRRAALRAAEGRHSRRRQRPQSPAPISRDGDPSAHALPGLRGLLGSLRLRARRAHDALPRRKMDQDHARLDHGHLALPHLRHLPRHALGLRRARLGRLLGLGPGRERQLHALAHRHRLSPLRHDAGDAKA